MNSLSTVGQSELTKLWSEHVVSLPMGPLGPWQPSAFSCNSYGCLPTSAPLQLNAADMISHNISEESKQRRETTIEYSTFSSVTDYSVTVTVDLRPLQFIYQHD